MERLFIAEKPSVARAIAASLGKTGAGDGYVLCGKDGVTWCVGHMLELAEPTTYLTGAGASLWRMEDLPIMPERWILEPKVDLKSQLSVIGELLKKTKRVVHAGDPDREGQLLVDEVLEHFAWAGQTQRFWVSAQDDASIRKGLESLRDNADYAGWRDAARGRQRADWLLGMNLTRAHTLRARNNGSKSLITVGRVQTPTLALVVKRDVEIRSFVAVPFYRVTATIRLAAATFTAKWVPAEGTRGLDSEGRVRDGQLATAIAERLKGKAGTVAEYDKYGVKKAPPLGYSLSDLTVAASEKFGYGAKQVLEICQALYETYKLTSYPRTDSQHLPTAQHAEVQDVLEALLHVNPELADVIGETDAQRRSRIWNDAKVTAHHAIIPTLHQGSKAKLSQPERDIYKLIVNRYVAQFYPDHEYDETKIAMLVDGERLEATGRATVAEGWRVLGKEDSDSAAELVEDGTKNSQDLPGPLSVTESQSVVCEAAERMEAKTKAPPRFTEGTLLRAMETIYRFVEDAEQRKILKEGDGIGTAATRPVVISELIAKGYLAKKGRQLVSTELGTAVVKFLPPALTSPALTAVFERMLKAIEGGKETLARFEVIQRGFVSDQVERVAKVARKGSAKVGE
jgi:DNA topoisomerase-3